MLISRKIIEAHSGEIWVDSELGKGTAIHFRLPVDEKVL
jgi:signal transduction histidine kinase